MNINVCTISFRHQLISFKQIALWAKHHRFSGIELWGVHAKNMDDRVECNKAWLHDHNLCVPMISDYLPLIGDEAIAVDKIKKLGDLCLKWGAKKIRTFAGDKASHNVSPDERKSWTKRLRDLCHIAEHFGLQLVVETHPNTLADTLCSTLQLIEDINHPALHINFDVIHVWESGDDVKQALHSLEPLISHVHLKNIADKSLLHLFSPANVYAPAGNRQGMTPLFDGAFDFSEFLAYVKERSNLCWDSLDASLEWFGTDVMSSLEKDNGIIEQHYNTQTNPAFNIKKQAATLV